MAEDQDELSKVVRSLHRSWLFSDVQIVLKNGYVPAHKIVLHARNGKWGGVNLAYATHLDWTALDTNVGSALIEWIYTSELSDEMDTPSTIALMKAAFNFDLLRLVYQCEQHLLKVNASKLRDRKNLSSCVSQSRVLPQADQTMESIRVTDDTHDTLNNEPIVNIHEPDVKIKIETQYEECMDDFLHDEDSSTEDNKRKMSRIAKKKKQRKTTNEKVINETKKRRKRISAKPQGTKTNLHAKVDSTGIKSEGSQIMLDKKTTYDCHICKKRYQKKAIFALHLEHHSLEYTHQCEKCAKVFKTKARLMGHMSTHKVPLKSKLSTPFQCPICHTYLQSDVKLASHLKLHSRENKSQCLQCSKLFKNKFKLLSHLKVHEDPKASETSMFKQSTPFQCQVCRVYLQSDANLTRHMKLHTSEHKCSECSRVFTTDFRLQAHMTVHSEVKNFECDKCPKQFKRKHDLHMHMIIHLGLKEFVCEECGHQSIRLADLRSHLKSAGHSQGKDLSRSKKMKTSEKRITAIQELYARWSNI